MGVYGRPGALALRVALPVAEISGDAATPGYGTAIVVLRPSKCQIGMDDPLEHSLRRTGSPSVVNGGGERWRKSGRYSTQRYVWCGNVTLGCIRWGLVPTARQRAQVTFASSFSCKFLRAGASMVLIGKDFWDFSS
jgi:hypothetical protein